MRTRPAGPRAILLECADAAEVAAWHAELRRRLDSGALVATDLVPAARTVLVDGVADPAGLAESLATMSAGRAAPPEPGTAVELDCVYDGPDLAEVAELWRTSVDGVVARHTGTEFRVAFCGFSPGFGYLTGLPAEFAVPRRDSPRPRVPAGAVGLAGEYSGVYPSPSPGGWRLIGRTGAVLFDPSASPPALLTPGTRVRFRAVPG
ncbi:allophanate hydrolase [Actinocatenispora thailandica]|uniref:Allophanate hydrolase n=1 Tax=Actinocatenispora thailandica TaxID=227318 RepID=A0A7R7I059_9ACTN|nr:allophanate hydrolase subunit 1 [Actinocatenispora thailandica]BCJ38973.1 allophanate hydrolase [Actinocatenispora thailandica]